MKKKTISIVAIVGILLVAVAFFGGMKYSQSQVVGLKGGGIYTGQQGKFGGGMNGNRAKGANVLTGEVLSMDDKSVTLKLVAGGSKIVLLSDKTQVVKSVEGSKADLKQGLNLMVTGIANTDGSVTAENVQIRPGQVKAAPVVVPTK